MEKIDDDHAHTAACREIVADGGNLEIRLVCGRTDPYIGGQWTDGIKVLRREKGYEQMVPWGTAIQELSTVVFKAQCCDCRAYFGRWWEVEGEGLTPTEEEVRARGKGLLEEAGFRRDGDGWHCPGATSVLLRSMTINEGAPMDGRIWPE